MPRTKKKPSKSRKRARSAPKKGKKKKKSMSKTQILRRAEIKMPLRQSYYKKVWVSHTFRFSRGGGSSTTGHILLNTVSCNNPNNPTSGTGGVDMKKTPGMSEMAAKYNSMTCIASNIKIFVRPYVDADISHATRFQFGVLTHPDVIPGRWSKFVATTKQLKHTKRVDGYYSGAGKMKTIRVSNWWSIKQSGLSKSNILNHASYKCPSDQVSLAQFNYYPVIWSRDDSLAFNHNSFEYDGTVRYLVVFQDPKTDFIN